MGDRDFQQHCPQPQKVTVITDTLPANLWVLGLYLGRRRRPRRQNRFCPVFLHYGVFIASIFIGLAAGLVTGCIGAGGGFIITPALMSAGIKGILAVGTDLFHIFAKAIMGTVVHRKMGNVSVKLAIAFLCRFPYRGHRRRRLEPLDL